MTVDQPAYWAQVVRDARRDGAADVVCAALKRLSVLTPYDQIAVSNLAAEVSGAGQFDHAAELLRRCMRLTPLDVRIYRAQATVLYLLAPIEEDPGPAFRDAIRRWIILDGNLPALRERLMQTLRRIGDVALIAKTIRWIGVMSATDARDLESNSGVSMLQRYAEIVHGFDLASIDRDFAPAITHGRVLLQPRLPDRGTWAVHGLDAEQRRRAIAILTYVNPEARVVDQDAPEAEGADVVAIGPSADPRHMLLPSLHGHWHVYWTNLANILDEDAVPRTDRLLAFALRTRDFVTFLYGKGHEQRYLADNQTRGRRIADKLADAASRDSYLETLSGDWARYFRGFYARICHRVQYFDYAVYRQGDVILNLGVAEGFEIPAYLALISPGGVVHNIDPEGDGRLGPSARAWIAGSDSTVHFHSHALSDLDGEVRMETGGCWEDVRIGKRTQGQVVTLPSVRLDTLIQRHAIDRIDHIKLDIEGGEEFLIDQLIAVMRSHRPQIEISIYHTVEQFFDIPERLMAGSTGYRFFFYRYSASFGEGTLYAIPEEIEPLMPIKP